MSLHETKIDDLAKVVANMLTDYGNNVREEVTKAGKQAAKELQKTLKETSPKNTGEYAKGWAVQEEGGYFEPSKFTVYNKDKPSLAHLLEYGYVHWKTGMRVKAYPHIKPAEEVAKERYVQLVKEGIKNANN